jgi:predicted hotdog family 3-hydroxylacyl-ACP dehydratase
VTYPAVAELVPHAGAMVLLERVLAHRGDETVCAARAEPGGLFCDASGALPAWLGLELMAQCIAVRAGLERRAGGEPPRLGFLLGSRRVTLRVPAFAAGQALEVVARRVFGSATGMVSFDCEIRDAASGASLADARLNCFMPSDDVALAAP